MTLKEKFERKFKVKIKDDSDYLVGVEAYHVWNWITTEYTPAILEEIKQSVENGNDWDTVIDAYLQEEL